MILFDRYGKLRKQLPGAAIHVGQKQLLPLLSGTLRKNDLPELIVVPTNVIELQTILKFAAEKDMRVAVASGHTPVSVQELEGAMLIFTHGLVGSAQLSSDGSGIWVGSGTPLETLAVELAQRGLVWLPLHPLESGETVATFFARACEGVRCHRGGSVLSNIRRVEWVDYEGNCYATGPGCPGDGVDVTALLYGSGARYGIITRFELALEQVPETRTLVLCECDSVGRVSEIHSGWRYGTPMPSALPVWTTTAVNAVRQGNDDFISNSTVGMIVGEWEGSVGVEVDSDVRSLRVDGVTQVNQVWQNLFRLPRTLGRLFPHRSVGRYRLPAEALCDFDERVRQLAKDRSVDVALWGTLDRGYLNVWVLHPDDEQRTARRARDLLERLAEDALNLSGCPIEAGSGMCDVSLYRDAISQSWELSLVTKCDKNSRYKLLRTQPSN